MSRLITGAANVPQQKTTGYSKSRGYYEAYVEDFTTLEAAEAMGWSLSPRGYEWECSPLGGGCWRLTARNDTAANGAGGVINNPNVPLNDIWELQPNVVEKDFLAADSSLVIGLSAFEIAQVREFGEDVKKDISGLIESQQTLVKLMRVGVTTTRVFAPVLRHQKLVRRDYTIKDSLTGVGNIYSPAALANRENIPGSLLFNLPNDSSQGRTDGLTFQYGWLKKYPVITQVSEGKWQLVQEWEYGLWSNDLYTYYAT